MKPSPVAASVAGPVTPILVPASQAVEPRTAMIPGPVEEDVSMAAPALRGAPAAVTPFPQKVEGSKPTAKRQKGVNKTCWK